MIDRSKNVCYVITVPYVLGDHFDTDYKYQKFLSLHGAQTKHFKDFMKKYFTEVLGVDERNIGECEGGGWVSYGTEQTISRKAWLDESTRKLVLEGITDREKCW